MNVLQVCAFALCAGSRPNLILGIPRKALQAISSPSMLRWRLVQTASPFYWLKLRARTAAVTHVGPTEVSCLGHVRRRSLVGELIPRRRACCIHDGHHQTTTSLQTPQTRSGYGHLTNRTQLFASPSCVMAMILRQSRKSLCCPQRTQVSW